MDCDLYVHKKGNTRAILKNKLTEQKGEGYVDVAVLVLCLMFVIALAVRVFPVYICKLQLDNFADEMVREAEMCGRVGEETSRREAVLREKTGLSPQVSWSVSGNIQLNEEVSVTLSLEKNIGLFGGIGSFPVTLQARAVGKSEVYHK